MHPEPYAVRKKIWKVLTPLFPFLRTTFGFLRYARYQGRETYPLGYIKKEIALAIVEQELARIGFVKYYVAWIDQGEVLGMRKSESFEYQYHIRIFNDGEVRGHFELSPEYQPFRHFFDFDKTPRTHEFLKMIEHLLQ